MSSCLQKADLCSQSHPPTRKAKKAPPMRPAAKRATRAPAPAPAPAARPQRARQSTLDFSKVQAGSVVEGAISVDSSDEYEEGKDSSSEPEEDSEDEKRKRKTKKVAPRKPVTKPSQDVEISTVNKRKRAAEALLEYDDDEDDDHSVAGSRVGAKKSSTGKKWGRK